MRKRKGEGKFDDVMIIECRAEDKRVIKRGAEIKDKSLAAFVRETATAEARRVINAQETPTQNNTRRTTTHGGKRKPKR